VSRVHQLTTDIMNTGESPSVTLPLSAILALAHSPTHTRALARCGDGIRDILGDSLTAQIPPLSADYVAFRVVSYVHGMLQAHRWSIHAAITNLDILSVAAWRMGKFTARSWIHKDYRRSLLDAREVALPRVTSSALGSLWVSEEDGLEPLLHDLTQRTIRVTPALIGLAAAVLTVTHVDTEDTTALAPMEVDADTRAQPSPNLPPRLPPRGQTTDFQVSPDLPRKCAHSSPEPRRRTLKLRLPLPVQSPAKTARLDLESGGTN
jgi:hypothetical protein